MLLLAHQHQPLGDGLLVSASITSLGLRISFSRKLHLPQAEQAAQEGEAWPRGLQP